MAGQDTPDTPDADVEILICPPFNGDAASTGNGTMMAFRVLSKPMVDAA